MHHQHGFISMLERLRTGVSRLWRPIDREMQVKLTRRWSALSVHLRTPQQLLGRQELGCGATVGVMPRCDFACTACYLGQDDNRARPLVVEAVKRQLRLLRDYLGPGGNLQLTDGEVTLRPVGELIEILCEARRLHLVPMLMTHGEAIRRDPKLLERLVVEGGLRELCVRVDSLQRGRGKKYRFARTEESLNELRHEFAELIRSTRVSTGCTLRVASTVTVSRDNLSQVPSVVAWFLRNADVFRLLSFQPIASVGRTLIGESIGVDVEDLWTQIETGINEAASRRTLADRWRRDCWHMGHDACSRILTGLVMGDEADTACFQSLSPTSGANAGVVADFINRFGGIRLRHLEKLAGLCCVLGMFARAPRLMGVEVPRAAWRIWRQLLEAHPERPSTARVAWRCLRGDTKFRRFTVVSHHFMSRVEIETPLGESRLQQCVFRVPLPDGTLMSMCEFNACGHRDRFYQGVSAASVTNFTYKRSLPG